MLSKSEVEILSVLFGVSGSDVSLGELAGELEWSHGHTSKVVSRLADRGFLRTERTGGRRLVTAANVPPVEQLGELTSEFGHVDFPTLISGSTLGIAYYLDQSRTATELAELSGVSRNTVYRRLDSLQNVGIVRKEHSRYELTDTFSALSDLARSIAHHDHRQEALDLTDGVTIIWETHDEYLLGCETPISSAAFLQTGPAVFEDFGIPLFTRERLHYFRTEGSQLTPADLVCHTLLIDDSTRYRSYCLLLIANHDVEETDLKERAMHYDPEATIDVVAVVRDLVTYLETDGEVRDETLPRWDDFKSTAAEYEISV